MSLSGHTGSQRRGFRSSGLWLLMLLAGAVVVAGCASTDDDSNADEPMSADTVVIATTNFTESRIIASLYSQVLEANGVPTQIKELTTREVIVPALEKNEIQLTPEYLGSLTEFLNKQENGSGAAQLASDDTAKTFKEGERLARNRSIELLPPSPAQDQNAFAVTREFAAEHDLKTMSELGEYSQQSPIILGGGPECPERPFCLPGIERVYNVQVEKFVPLDSGGPLTIQGLKQGLIQVGIVFSSSGAVASEEIVVLEDDQGLQIAENITPAMAVAAVTDRITGPINELSAAMTTEDLQLLNAEVELGRRPVEAVATEFLQQSGLIDS